VQVSGKLLIFIAKWNTFLDATFHRIRRENTKKDKDDNFCLGKVSIIPGRTPLSIG
jgi:hypothetical protein